MDDEEGMAGCVERWGEAKGALFFCVLFMFQTCQLNVPPYQMSLARVFYHRPRFAVLDGM